MKKIIPFKRGDTFKRRNTYMLEVDGVRTPIDITGYTIRAHIRSADTLIQSLTVNIIDAVNGVYDLVAEKEQTELWPVGLLKMDIEFTIGGFRKSTEDIIIEVLKDQTR